MSFLRRIIFVKILHVSKHFVGINTFIFETKIMERRKYLPNFFDNIRRAITRT